MSLFRRNILDGFDSWMINFSQTYDIPINNIAFAYKIDNGIKESLINDSRFLYGDGLAYLATNILPSEVYGFDAKIGKNQSTNYNAWNSVISSTLDKYTIGTNNGTLNLYCRINGTQISNALTYDDNGVYHIIAKDGVFRNNDVVISSSYTTPVWSSTTDYIYIFNNSAQSRCSAMKLAKYVTYNSNGDVAHYLVPFVNADGECGMIDLKTNTFFGNISTSGKFTIL